MGEKQALRVFSLAELATFGGKEGRPAYIACKGKVYNVTDSALWEEGTHEMEHSAGQDLSASLDLAPHGEEVILQFPVVGELR